MPDAILPDPECDTCFIKAENRRFVLGCIAQIVSLIAAAAAIWYGGGFILFLISEIISGHTAFTALMSAAGILFVFGLLSGLIAVSLMDRGHKKESTAVKSCLIAAMMLFSFAAITALKAVLSIFVP